MKVAGRFAESAGWWLIAILVTAGIVLSIWWPGFKPSAQSNPTPSPTPSVTATPTGLAESLASDFDLYKPGLAREVVKELIAKSNSTNIVQLSLTRTKADLTYHDSKNRPYTLTWRAGKISLNDDGTDLVNALTFDPLNFKFDNLPKLFEQATQVSGSAENQQLQITEYHRGQVAMTVTTNPESVTVFFDRSGVLIPILDYRSAVGIKAGLAAAAGDRSKVIAVGIEDANTLWVDVVVSPGVVERRMRVANVPAYAAQRKESTDVAQFDISLLKPEVLVRLVRGEVAGLDTADGPANVIIRQSKNSTSPLIKVSEGTTEVLTDLSGTPVVS